MFAALNAFLTRAVSGYFLNKSLRFRGSASAYLNRTPTTTGSRTTFTWSGWVKRGALGTGSGNRRAIFSSGRTDGSPQNGLVFRFFDDQINASSGGGVSLSLTSSAVYRDPAAWYHLVFAVDTTQGTASNRVKIYVNGAQVTSFGTATYPSASQSFDINTSSYTAYNGAENDTATLVYFFDGEMAEVNFVDGQALAPTAFGASSIYNQWLPIKYAGPYGTNGFYLPFTNTASTSTLVADSSGNANNWTPNNISLTAGSTYDSLTDVPTLTSTTVANYPVLSPLSTYNGGGTLSNGNLTVSLPDFSNNKPTIVADTGKWYAEFTCVSAGGYSGTGLAIVTSGASTLYPITLLRTDYANNGQTYSYNASAYVSYGASWTSGDVIGVAWDCSAAQVTFYKNGVSQGAISSPTLSLTTNGSSFNFIPSNYNTTVTASFSVNYGQQPWKYSIPTGFLPLNTFNI